MEKEVGRLLFVLGVIFLLAALLVENNVKLPFGRLPGDIVIKRNDFVFYFPLATGIFVSIILTLIFSFVWRK